MSDQNLSALITEPPTIPSDRPMRRLFIRMLILAVLAGILVIPAFPLLDATNGMSFLFAYPVLFGVIVMTGAWSVRRGNLVAGQLCSRRDEPNGKPIFHGRNVERGDVDLARRDVFSQ